MPGSASVKPVYEPSKRRLTWPNGAIADRRDHGRSKGRHRRAKKPADFLPFSSKPRPESPVSNATGPTFSCGHRGVRSGNFAYIFLTSFSTDARPGWRPVQPPSRPPARHRDDDKLNARHPFLGHSGLLVDKAGRRSMLRCSRSALLEMFGSNPAGGHGRLTAMAEGPYTQRSRPSRANHGFRRNRFSRWPDRPASAFTRRCSTTGCCWG